MFVILFSIIIGMIMLIIKFKEFINIRNNLKLILTNKKLNHYAFYHIFLFLYIIFILVGIFSTFVGFKNNDSTTSAMGIIITLLFLSEAINAPYKYCLYYDNNIFVVKDKAIRYKSILNFEKIKYIPIAFIKINTINGQSYRVSPKSFEIIYSHYQALKKK